MKQNILRMTLACGMLCTLFSSCSKKNNSWDDSKSSSSYRYKHSQSLWGNDGDQQLASADEFDGPAQEDFIPLRDEDLKSQFADGAIPQSRHSPGEAGSGIPGIDQFYNPTADLATVFRNVYFNTDDYIVRGQDSLAALDRIAAYLKSHPNTYVFVEGHCDERGPEAYNLSLGARRANAIRSTLVKKGADLNQVHTISYGKERPADTSHTSDAWTKNRRAQFKIFQR